MPGCGWRIQRVLGLGSLLLVSVACSPGSTPKPKYRWPAPPPEIATPDQYPEAEAVYLSRTAELRFPNWRDPTSGFALTVHDRIQILTPAGRSRGRVAIPVDSWSALQDVTARSYDAAGAAGGGDLSEVSLPRNAVAFAPLTHSGILYSDSRVGAFDIPNAEPGRIVEYRYTLRTRQIFSLPTWQFDTVIPVRQSSLTVIGPPGWSLRWGFAEAGEARAQAPEPERRPNPDGSETIVWRMQDLDALEPVQMGLPLEHMARQLSFTVAEAPGISFAQWRDVAAFYRQLTGDLAPAPAGAVEELASFAGVSGSADIPPEAIYRFVRDSIRYVAIEQGIGALKPHAADAVYGARLGDCKDMATLMVSLFAHHGIEAFPVLISTRGHARFHTEVPTVSAFDHAIVAVADPEGGYIYLDPTAKHYPYGAVPWGIQGRPAIVVKPGGVDVVTLPMWDSEANVMEIHWHVGASQSSLKITAKGEPSHGWRGLTAGRASNARLKDQLEGLLVDLEAATVVTATIDADPQEVRIEATLATPHVIHEAGGRRFIPLGPFFGDTSEVRIRADRRSPVELGYPGRFVVRVTYDLPRGARVLHVPKHDPLDFEVAAYALAAKTSSRQVEVETSFVRKRDRVPADLLPQIRQISERITYDSREALVLR